MTPLCRNGAYFLLVFYQKIRIGIRNSNYKSWGIIGHDRVRVTAQFGRRVSFSFGVCLMSRGEGCVCVAGLACRGWRRMIDVLVSGAPAIGQAQLSITRSSALGAARLRSAWSLHQLTSYFL